VSSPEANVAWSLLESLDYSWGSLRDRTANLSDAELTWEPVPSCWTVRAVGSAWLADWADPDPEPPPVTTITWRCWHIAVDCLDSYTHRLTGNSPTGLTGRSWVGTWSEARALMERAWVGFRAGVAGWDESALFAPLGARWGPYARHSHLDLALHAQREVIHHAAEIALLRDLYRARIDAS
jgi:hypothetical protein